MENLKLEIDWEAYFKEFCEVHGADPITDASGNYLLFQDGWRYHSNRPSGPEYPPEDESHACSIKITYWTLRRKKAEREYLQLTDRISTLRNLQETLSAPLMIRTTVFDEDLEREIPASKRVDFDLLEARAEWLRRDIEDAKVKIKLIEEKEKSDGSKSNSEQYEI